LPGGQRLEDRIALAAASIVITELMYHPRISAAEEAAGFTEDDFEFVEVENVGTATASLAGFRLQGGVDFDFGPLALAPRQQAVLAKNQQALQFRYGTGPLVLGEFDGTLSNNNERLTLLDPAGQPVLDFVYRDSWYPATDGTGLSLNVVDPLASPLNWGLASNWRPSSVDGGTPGASDNGNPPGYLRAPQRVEAAMRSVRHVELKWTPPAATPRPVAAYRVYRNGVAIGESKSSPWLDASAAPDSSFLYQVSAVDDRGGEASLSQSVAVKIEPLGGEPAFAPAEATGVVESFALSELSGLAASRRAPGVLWTMNDRSGTDTIYAIGEQAEFLGSVTLFGVNALDWEDLAVGPGPVRGVSYVYVGDIGDNSLSRQELVVYRFPEPAAQQIRPDEPLFLGPMQYEVLRLQYPSGPADAESLMVDPLTGDLFVVTKETGTSRLFQVPARQLVEGDTITMSEAGTVELKDPSAADIAPDGSEILLRNENTVLLYPRKEEGETVAQALARPGESMPVVGTPVEPNGEAISYAADNRGYFTISEGVNSTLYYFRRLGPAQAGDADRNGFFNTRDLVQVFQAGRYDTRQPALWSEGDWTGDGLFDSSDLVRAFQVGGYESPRGAAALDAAGELQSERFQPAPTADPSQAADGDSEDLEPALVDVALSGILDRESDWRL
jgi:hypothetical protein